MLAKCVVGILCVVILCVAAIVVSLTYKLIRKIIRPE